MVNDVLVSPSSFLPKALGCLCGESRRDELRRVASESASEYQKKDDAAHATAKFAFFDG